MYTSDTHPQGAKGAHENTIAPTSTRQPIEKKNSTFSADRSTHGLVDGDSRRQRGRRSSLLKQVVYSSSELPLP